MILNNLMALQISQTPKVLCQLLFLLLNRHRPIGTKGKLIKTIRVNIIFCYLYSNYNLNVIKIFFFLHFLVNTNSQESSCPPKPPCSPKKRLQGSESMRELQRAYTPVCKRNGSTGDLLSQTDSLDGTFMLYTNVSYEKCSLFFFSRNHVLIVLFLNFRL